MSANEIQIGGNHYKEMSVQPWDAMRAWMGRLEFIGFLRGNIIKYVARAGAKGDKLQDLKKARHYLDKLIEEMECEKLAQMEADECAPKLLPWEIARKEVLKIYPKAVCIPWGEDSYIISGNSEKNWDRRLGDGRAGWDAWMDAADRLLKAQSA